jgi:hypothetical protein
VLVGAIWAAIPESEQDIVCRADRLVRQAQSQAFTGSLAGSRFTFQEEGAQVDAGRDEGRRLLRALATDVVRNLKASQGLTPKDKAPTLR